MLKHKDRIELHAHSSASDGCFSPEEIVRLASSSRISSLAITDHDTVAALAPARAAGAACGVEVISGVELSAIYQDREIHFLGYFIDERSDFLIEKLEDLVENRLARAERIVRKFNALGYPITLDEVKTAAGQEGLLGRPHVALVLMRHGIVDSITEAFQRFLNPGRPGYVPRLKLSHSEAIGLIIKAHGLPVLAHPGLDFPLALLPECLEAGLLGIECYHPRHTAVQTKRYVEIARKNNLIISGGSDFHGYEREDWQNLGNFSPPETLRQLLNERNKQGNPNKHLQK